MAKRTLIDISCDLADIKNSIGERNPEAQGSVQSIILMINRFSFKQEDRSEAQAYFAVLETEAPAFYQEVMKLFDEALEVQKSKRGNRLLAGAAAVVLGGAAAWYGWRNYIQNPVPAEIDNTSAIEQKTR